MELVRNQSKHLEGVLQPDEEGEANRLQDAFLIQCVFYLFQLDHLKKSQTAIYLVFPYYK